MGGTAPRSLCLGGEPLFLSGAQQFVHRPWIKTPRGANTLYLNSLLDRDTISWLTDFPSTYRHRALAVRPTLDRHNGPLSFRH